MNVDTIKRFCNLYWSHPYWALTDNPWIRLSFLPTDYQLKVLKVKKGAYERTVHREQLDEMAKRVMVANQRGYDIFYNVNAVREDLGPAERGENFCTNADIVQRLFFPLDLDYRLTIDPNDLAQETTRLAFYYCGISSRRDFAHHQYLLAVSVADGVSANEQRLRELCSKFCSSFGSDPVADTKRLFRMPGTINWKGVDKSITEEQLKNDRLRAKIVFDDGSSPVLWGLDEIEAAVSNFYKTKLSEEFRSLGFRPRLKGGALEDERGLYGRWADALSASRSGKWTIGKGARHNALCSWGWQMSATRLPKATVVANVRELARGAFEEPYEESRDLDRLIMDIEKGWEKIDHELDSFVEESIEEDYLHTSDQHTNDTPEQTAARAGHLLGQVQPGAYLNGHAKENVADQPEMLPVEYRAPRYSFTQYAQRLARQCNDQTKEQWIDWLASLALARTFCNKRGSETFEPFGALVYKRLCAIGLNVGDCFSTSCSGVLVPMQREDCMSFLRHLLWGIQKTSIVHRADIEASPRFIEGKRDLKDAKVIFSVRDPYISEFTKSLMAHAQDNRRLEKDFDYVIAKNGRQRVSSASHDQSAWEWMPDAVSSSPAGGKIAGVDVLRACVREPGALAINLGPLPGGACLGEENGYGDGLTPMFDRYVSESFPGDEGAYELLLRIIGYCLLPNNPLHKLFVFEGVSGAGKGILSEIISHLVGEDWSTSTQLKRLVSDAGLGPVWRHSVVVIDEAEGLRKDEANEALAMLKRAVGGERIAVRSLFQDEKIVRIGAKFILLCNKPFNFDDTAGAFYNRAVPVHFSTVVDRSQTLGLSKAIFEREGSNIGRKAMEALRRGLPLGNKMFHVEQCSALSAGREGLLGTTGGIRGFLEKIVIKHEFESGKNLSTKFVELLIKAALKQELFEGPGRGGGRTNTIIVRELEQLGVRYDNHVPYPCNLPRGRGFFNCSIDKAALLALLELGSDKELAHLLGSLLQGDEKTKQLACFYLELSPELFSGIDFEEIDDDTFHLEH